MKTIDCTHNYGQTGRNRRDDFWRAFCEQQSRRRAIAAKLRYLVGAEADPAVLTPGQIEKIPSKIARLLADLGGVPAYRSKLDEVRPRLSLFASAAKDWLDEYNADTPRDRVIAAKAAVDKIFGDMAPKSPTAWRSWKAPARFAAAKAYAERVLNRDFLGLTSRERRFAMSTFEQFQQENQK